MFDICSVFSHAAVDHLALLMFPYIMATLVVVCVFCSPKRDSVIVCRPCTGVDLLGQYLTDYRPVLICTNMGCRLGNKHQPSLPLSVLKTTFFIIVVPREELHPSLGRDSMILTP